MRVLLSHVGVGRGGDAVQILSLADALRTQGHEVILVGDSSPAPYARGTLSARARTAARGLPWWARDLLEVGLGFAAAWRVFRTARQQAPGLWIHRAATHDLLMAPIHRRLRIPLVLLLDAHVEAERAFRGVGYWRRLHAVVMRALGGEAIVIVTPSQAVADYYSRLGLPGERMRVRRNGVSARHLRLGHAVVDTHPPLDDPESCTLGFAGSLSRWHRVDLLLQALRILRGCSRAGAGPGAGGPVCRLLIVGSGEEEGALRAHVKDLDLGELVEWRGPLPHDDAVAAMREFDIAVLPNTLPTGSPMKLSEYAAMGRPIIAPDYPNIRDMFACGGEIILVPPGDAMALAQAVRSLVADPDRARRMGRAAQARLRHALWEDTADMLVNCAAGREDSHPIGRDRF